MRVTAAVVVTLTFAGIVAGVSAQPRVPLEILQKSDISVPWLEAVATVADFEPGSTTGLHAHPGEMVGYIVQGSVVVEQEGKALVTLNAGQAFVIPEGVAHNFTNSGREAARMFATYIVEKDKPLRTPVAAK